MVVPDPHVRAYALANPAFPLAGLPIEDEDLLSLRMVVRREDRVGSVLHDRRDLARLRRPDEMDALAAYLLAQMIDVQLFHFWKRVTHGRHGEHHRGVGRLAPVQAASGRELGDAVDVRLIEDRVAETILSWRPHLLGISSVSQNYNLAKRYAELGREAGIPVIGLKGLDLAVNYSIPVWKSLAPWVKIEVRNLFNERKKIGWLVMLYLVITTMLLCGVASAQDGSFYKGPAVFSTRPSETKSLQNIKRFGPVGMGIDLLQPPFDRSHKRPGGYLIKHKLEAAKAKPAMRPKERRALARALSISSIRMSVTTTSGSAAGTKAMSSVASEAVPTMSMSSASRSARIVSSSASASA